LLFGKRSYSLTIFPMAGILVWPCLGITIREGATVMTISPRQRLAVITAALLALFLGAMDALIVSAAMPTIVAELGGLHLYSWVYSSYFLSRAVSLPIFGKLADLYPNRSLFIVAIGLFIASSAAAGGAVNMIALIVARVFQGIGAGGIFALVYVVLADVSPPESRGRTLSLASSVWGDCQRPGSHPGRVCRDLFLLALDLFHQSAVGAGRGLGHRGLSGRTAHPEGHGRAGLRRCRQPVHGHPGLPVSPFCWADAITPGPRPRSSVCSSCRRPALPLSLSSSSGRRIRSCPSPFFGIRGFSTGNAAVFLSSFAIFAMFAFAPLFIQGAQGRSPMEVGVAMLSLSLGWSLGSIALGQFIDRIGRKGTAVAGAVMPPGRVRRDPEFQSSHLDPLSLLHFFSDRHRHGLGGAVHPAGGPVLRGIPKTLGVATSSNQFARTLGGAVGVGICGSFIATRFARPVRGGARGRPDAAICRPG
jgi:MFS family permease